ncbi:hypothetical protein LPJ75_003246 [Coemansia sp. RSA 2598]|nr:hypothetical protein LPJ75_003246 [Coemansia sp. RSA 2598]
MRPCTRFPRNQAGRASLLRIPAADGRSAPLSTPALSEIVACTRSGEASFCSSSASPAPCPAGQKALFAHIESKHKDISCLPGIEQLNSYPSSSDVASEQCQLLLAHVDYIDALFSEHRLLSQLCQHAAANPIYEVAQGLEKYFGGLITSLSLKLEIAAAEMHQTLYSPEVSQAINRLWGILKAQEAKLTKEHAALSERLAIYRDAGAEFQEIAAAYTHVLAETEKVRQDIARVSQI